MSLPERVRSRSDLTDEQLFQKGVVRVSVEVTPEIRQTPQENVILRGFIGGKEIEVVFPATRRAAALQLAQRLRRSVEVAKAAAAPIAEFRQKIHIDGVWRVRLLDQSRGMPDRRFQLVAARWRYRGPDGAMHVDGTIPYT